MLALAPRRLYPGHGPVIEDACDLLLRYQAHRRAREEQVRAHVRHGSGVRDGGRDDERGSLCWSSITVTFRANPS